VIAGNGKHPLGGPSETSQAPPEELPLIDDGPSLDECLGNPDAP